MSNQEMRTELQRLGIQTCESMPKEFLQSLLKFSAELKVTPSNAQTCSMAPVDNDFEAFFCPICTDEYSPIELGKTPRNLECGHSFCMNCLVKSRSQHRNENLPHFHSASVAYGVKCPTCRSLTLVRTKDDVKALPKNFTAIAMLQSAKRQSIEANSSASKRRRFDNTQALADAARMCELLEGRPNVCKDPSKAFQMAAEGSQAGCIHSMGILGRCYFTGSGVELDVQRGLQLGRDSAVAGSAYGEFVVALAYESGLGGVEKDLEEAIEHYKVALQLDMAEAQYCLAGIYLKDSWFRIYGDPTLPKVQLAIKNDAEGLKLLRLASEHGHADSQISLAIRLSENCDASSHNEAVRLLKLALKQGTPRRHLEGLHKIAYCYTKLGDHVEAFNCHRLASDQGHSESSFQLASMYSCGEGVDKDVEEAIKIWKQLIENSKNAQKCSMASKHFRGRCFEAIRDLHLERGDIAEAFKWCKLGADERDQLQLLYDLARMYEGWDPQYVGLNVPLEGDGIERDFVKAAKCYTLACELFLDANDDVADSAYELAKMCGLPAPRRLMIP